MPSVSAKNPVPGRLIVSAKLRASILGLREQGKTLADFLQDLPAENHDKARAVWKAVKPKAPGYREAVAWIAENDEPGTTYDNDPDSPYWIGGISTVAMVADLFGKSPAVVGADVLKERERLANSDRA